ncbi:hypothetical protein R3W88_012331 [Solanum pinnatisectum]|uniref:F-box domain-containing protein n=1 Tax=Solanum pinnatisectum TaxID=50273 RepID=A0AAV9LA10_9SOLN|nr:hypothetical protein R3W88_012331 [Solanum pinnatisectum]
MDCQCHFPENMVVDILSRLPVESLLRFKCVCKHWYGLIKSASFKEKHFHQKNNLSPCLRLQNSKDHTRLRKVCGVLFAPEKNSSGCDP